MLEDAGELRIAQRVTEAREYLELSVEELAGMVRVAPDEIHAMEAGDGPIGASLLSAVAKALGRSLEFFTADVSVGAVAERTRFLARAAETLSEQDMGELQRFAIYLRSRSEGASA